MKKLLLQSDSLFFIYYVSVKNLQPLNRLQIKKKKKDFVVVFSQVLFLTIYIWHSLFLPYFLPFFK